jgi:hypothetical protein
MFEVKGGNQAVNRPRYDGKIPKHCWGYFEKVLKKPQKVKFYKKYQEIPNKKKITSWIKKESQRSNVRYPFAGANRKFSLLPNKYREHSYLISNTIINGQRDSMD